MYDKAIFLSTAAGRTLLGCNRLDPLLQGFVHLVRRFSHDPVTSLEDVRCCFGTELIDDWLLHGWCADRIPCSAAEEHRLVNGIALERNL